MPDAEGGNRTLCVLINEASETGHRVQSPSTIENIDIQEGDQSQSELVTGTTQIPVLRDKYLLDWMESHHLLEEVEIIISDRGVREVGNFGASWPRDNRYECNLQ